MRADARPSRLARAAASAAVFVCLLACQRERVAPPPAQSQRVVTLSPNVTELLFAIGAGDSIIGTDDNSNYPEPAKKLPKVGGMQPNIEKIVALKPDLVIASTEGNHPNLEPALRAVRIPLLVVKSDRLADVTAAMRTLGAKLNAPRTNEAVAALASALRAQKRTRPKPRRVLFAVWTDPLYAAGRNTFTDDLYALCGAQNAVQVNGWPQYSLESLVANPPDLILYPRRSVTRQQMDELLARAPGVQASVEAVDDDVFQRPGPRIAEAARTLNAILDRAE